MFKTLSVAAAASTLLLCSMASAQEASPAPAAPAATAAGVPLRSGVLLRSAEGRRLGFVDRIESKDGTPAFAQVIVDQRIVRVPVSTISPVDKGHFTTSMNYKDVTRR